MRNKKVAGIVAGVALAIAAPAGIAMAAPASNDSPGQVGVRAGTGCPNVDLATVFEEPSEASPPVGSVHGGSCYNIDDVVEVGGTHWIAIQSDSSRWGWVQYRYIEVRP